LKRENNRISGNPPEKVQEHFGQVPRKSGNQTPILGPDLRLTLSKDMGRGISLPVLP